MMRRTLAAITLALAASAASFGQTVDEVRRELDQGGRAYRAGRFEEAEQHFRRALELDPEGKDTRLFIARAVQQQYKPGVQTPENLAHGERAIAAYQEILAKDPANEDAYKAVVFLYGQMKRDDKVAEMLTQRANDFSAPNRQRAEAFTTLASRQWQCSFDVTEQNKSTEQPKEEKPADQKENKPAEQKPVKAVTKYKMPADAGDFIRARQCAIDGMQFAEQAVTLDPDSPNAWSYKANLLREAAKLAEMEGNAAQKDEYDRQYLEAFETQKRVSAEAARKAKAEEQERAAAAAKAAPTPRPAAPPRRAPFTATVLDGKATSKPMPPYPPEAKAAGVEGTVVVRVAVDEAGKVVEAEAISGHPLLREASVAAARRALFAPALLSGRAVKVSGVLTYKFALNPQAARPPR